MPKENIPLLPWSVMNPFRTQWSVMKCLGAAVGVLVFAGCNTGPTPDVGSDDGYPGISMHAQPLSDLSAGCALSGTTVTLTMAGTDTVIISKRTVDSALLINGIATCGAAASVSTTTAKSFVLAGTGVKTIILDFSNGTFFPGASSAVGFNLTALTASDFLKIRGTKSGDTIVAGVDGLNVTGDAFKDISLTAAALPDLTISAGDGNDSVSGNGGFGTGVVFTGPLAIFGGAGNDVLTGGSGADTIKGGDGADTMKGGAGTDVLDGEEGSDTSDEGTAPSGADEFYDTGTGLADVDTVSYASRTVGVTVTIDSIADDGQTGASEGDNVRTGIEGVVGTGYADILVGPPSGAVAQDGGVLTSADGGVAFASLNGGAGADLLVSGKGSDTLNGGDGDDTFAEGVPANGADVIIGGNGTDVVDYSQTWDFANAVLMAGTRTVTGVTVTIDGVANDGTTGASENDNVQTTVENLVGTAMADVLTGSASNNKIWGMDGADTISGGAGDDTFVVLAATDGADKYLGGAGVDTVDYSDAALVQGMAVVMDANASGVGTAGTLDAVGDTIGTDVENVYCPPANACTVTGNAADNYVKGSSAVDTMSGLGGDDILDGNGGQDVITCGAGNDIAIASPRTDVDPVSCEL